MEETAYAKINLALHVRGREADGYHRIETLFAFAEDGDRLEVSDGEGISLDITGPFADALAEGSGGGGDNLVLRAAFALAGRAGTPRGAALRLDKRLPVASGIGGGSADAAAALRLLVRWWELDLAQAEVQDLARDLGADVPACLASATALGTGRGDRLAPVGLDLAGTPVLLVNPGVALSTAAVFRAWDGSDRGPLRLDPLSGRNDLEAPARDLAPGIGDVLCELGRCPGARLVRMSGSGATCFALFESAGHRDAASAHIAAARPGWWTLASRLR